VAQSLIVRTVRISLSWARHGDRDWSDRAPRPSARTSTSMGARPATFDPRAGASSDVGSRMDSRRRRTDRPERAEALVGSTAS
jgi:hypothetical protein